MTCERHAEEPLFALGRMFRGGVQDPVRSAGENHHDFEAIAVAPAYAAWCWGVTRLIDGIVVASHLPQSPLPVNASRIAVSGCSQPRIGDQRRPAGTPAASC